MQKYDKEVLAKDWDTKLKIALGEESSHFEELSKAEDKLECAIQEGESVAEVEEAKIKVNNIKDSVPPQLQCVWDNLNLRTVHRKVFNNKKY